MNTERLIPGPPIITRRGPYQPQHEALANGYVCTFLESDWLSRAAALDERCYPCPWSEELFSHEFSKDISLITGIARGDTARGGALIAHCFTHMICEELHVLNLAVLSEFRRYGLGRALLCFTIAAAIRRGVNYATLEVRTSNFSAQKLYSNLGFRVAGLRKQYYHDNLEDALILSRTLSQRDYALFRGRMFACKFNLLGRFDEEAGLGV